MEKFNYYFNTQDRINCVLSGPVNKSTIPSIIFHLVWYAYYNISNDEKDIVEYIENWMKSKSNIFHLSAYATTIRRYVKKMKDIPWRNIQDTVKIRKSELDYISSFNDIKKEKLLFCYLAVAKFMDMSRSTSSHWESESDSAIFKMARVTIPVSERDYFLNEMINGEPKALIHLALKNDDLSKRIDYISDDENDPVILELDESNYYELAYTYLNWKNGGGFKKCKNCGRLFRVKSITTDNGVKTKDGQRKESLYCRVCSPTYDPKYKGKDDMSLDYEPKKIVCSNCGDEFYLKSYKDSRTFMCDECYAVYRRNKKTETMRNLRLKK
ncbi:MAG: hypothetical protein ACI4XN_04310 [Candidatus Kurthia intestinigallinarum]